MIMIRDQRDRPDCIANEMLARFGACVHRRVSD
jgi:hypothetical protein